MRSSWDTCDRSGTLTPSNFHRVILLVLVLKASLKLSNSFWFLYGKVSWLFILINSIVTCLDEQFNRKVPWFLLIINKLSESCGKVCDKFVEGGTQGDPEAEGYFCLVWHRPESLTEWWLFLKGFQEQDVMTCLSAVRQMSSSLHWGCSGPT